ncbi:polyhydroxyalkanoate depolymerase [Telmatospirillum siberiense]|uniref:Polyhydroxyalkanoate depolymerase n=1 Tax=Telmatospirillum siberiense TaxID=382514 RepID=A0A2N3PMP5_9PROT|nr:polyhydroxyalkanoate depolymerase [Telmatospirillum siberiense]PKU21660.1 polyhydroxyalkanoate depolymerase [Telmatospirillum siberiense]
MLYLAYQMQSNLMAPLRAMAAAVRSGSDPIRETSGGFTWSHLVAAWELISRAGLSHQQPAYGIDTVRIGERDVAVVEESAAVTPFCTLRHFRKAEEGVPQPRLLVVAPLSGHFATLLRGTIRTMLPDHDVYVTDWSNARDVSVDHGSFGFDDYVEHVIHFLEVLGPGAHVLAVCQPCVQVLAAVAVMAADHHPAQPASMTLMAGPIDVRVNPTKVNELATSKPIEWFERKLIATVPWPHRGAGRRVYPGFIQLLAFISMNVGRHLKAHRDLYDHLVKGETDRAEAIKAFYDEYFAVLDLSADFYLETVRIVFQEARLAKGELTYRGRAVDPGLIRRTALLTVEGEKDDICAVGQTAAAHDLCTGLKPYMRRHHLQAGVGHYGVFNGKRWEGQIYPIVRNLILATN